MNCPFTIDDTVILTSAREVQVHAFQGALMHGSTAISGCVPQKESEGIKEMADVHPMLILEKVLS